MSKRITIKDVAKKTGKSITTVSRALAGYDDVSPDTREMVRAVAEEMGYKPNIMAQRLQKQSADTLGIVLPVFGPGFAEPFFNQFLAGVGNHAADLGYVLFVAYAKEGEEIEAYRKLIDGYRVDGFLLVRTLRHDERVKYLCKRKFPFVAFGRIAEEEEICFPYVDEDGAWVMEQLAHYLAELGHRKIAVISPSRKLMSAYERLRGLRKGLQEHGIQVPDQYLRTGNFDQKDGYREAINLLDLPDPPTAIVGFNDMLAFGAINAAKERSLKIGKDISITGFDDIPIARHFRPPLTTVFQPTFEIGSQVCDMLVRLIQEEAVKDTQILMRPTLVIRESCGSPLVDAN